VRLTVAGGAERDQVFLGILARVTTEFFVMNFQIRHCAAGLTSPAIAAENLLPQMCVRNGIEPHTRGC